MDHKKVIQGGLGVMGLYLLLAVAFFQWSSWRGAVQASGTGGVARRFYR